MKRKNGNLFDYLWNTVRESATMYVEEGPGWMRVRADVFNSVEVPVGDLVGDSTFEDVEIWRLSEGNA